ncbi:MAG: NrtA/SsuA/CpmA family ABC transporter substrate-binding protein [Acidaminococcaceae bacterium]
MKKLLGLLTITTLCLLTLASTTGCGSQEKKAATAPPQVVNITYVKSPLNIPSIIDKNINTVSKAFAKTNTKVNFPEINSGAKQTEALAAGSLDICSALGGTSAILAASNGVDVKIIGIYSRAPQAFNIMSKNPELKTLADLKGKTVAGPKGTILHQILLAGLDKAGLQASDVELLSMDIPPSVTAMLNENVDAALVAGADVLRAQKAGAHILANGEGLVDATIVIATSNKFLQTHPEAIKQYLEAHKENIAFLHKNQAQAYEFTAKATGLQPAEVRAMAPWYNFDPTLTPQDLTELEKTQEFLLKAGLQKNKIDIKNLIVKL